MKIRNVKYAMKKFQMMKKLEINVNNVGIIFAVNVYIYISKN